VHGSSITLNLYPHYARKAVAGNQNRHAHMMIDDYQDSYEEANALKHHGKNLLIQN